jgi:carotenoid cleavage dioxygenase
MTDTADAPVHPMMSGPLEPVRDELDVADLRVHGEIPAALSGSYLRNGGNPAFPPLGKYHIFDGDGMIHAMTFDEGRARYRNRWVESKGLLAERQAGRAIFGGLMEFVMPDQDIIDAVGIMKNTANTNVINHAGRILALMEGAKPTQLAPDLSTIGEIDFDGKLEGAMTAHPRVDPDSGEMHFFGYSPMAPYLRYHVVDAHGVLTRSVEIDIPKPVMMHDFVITENHVVFFDLPAIFDLDAAITGGAPISWQPQCGARIGVMPRHGGDDDVRWHEIDPCYVFHFVNAWEEGDAIVVDGCRADALGTSFGDEPNPEPFPPHLHRWRIEDGAVAQEQLDDREVDFPRTADSVTGRPNRFGYAACGTFGLDIAKFDSVIKYDLEKGTDTQWSYGPNASAGEAVFAADPDGSAEDDGWLLNFATDLSTNTSEFVILDARDIGAGPVARIELPRRVPFGFHGNWMAGVQG